ncbi:unnamed protein product [Closterium sp. NIES-53]
MASWRSTATYLDAYPPPGVNVVNGMWIFKVKRPPESPPVFKARYVARGFSHREGVDFFQSFTQTPKMTTLRVLLHVAAQQDYELHSLDFSTTFLQGRLHEEIWLHRPPGFTGTFLHETNRATTSLGHPTTLTAASTSSYSPVLACHVEVATAAAAAAVAAAPVVAAAVKAVTAVAAAAAAAPAAASTAGPCRTWPVHTLAPQKVLSVGAAATTSLVPAFVFGLGATSPTAQLSFTPDSGASSCFSRDYTDLTPLHTPDTVALADPFVGSVFAHNTTLLPCLVAPSGFLTGYYTPSFSRNLVGVGHFHDLGVVTTFPLDERDASCTVGATGVPLATFHRESGSGLYSLHTGSHHTGSGQVMSGLPESLALLPHSPAPPCTSCVKGRQCAAPHSSSFPPTKALFHTLHLDIWGPSQSVAHVKSATS